MFTCPTLKIYYQPGVWAVMLENDNPNFGETIHFPRLKCIVMHCRVIRQGVGYKIVICIFAVCSCDPSFPLYRCSTHASLFSDLEMTKTTMSRSPTIYSALNEITALPPPPPPLPAARL